MEDDFSELYAHLATLDLEPGSTIVAVKEAQRTHVKVWHPDRFEHDPKLRNRAEKKLKEINEAYDWLNDNQHLLVSHHSTARAVDVATPTRRYPTLGRTQTRPEPVNSQTCKYCRRLLFIEQLARSGNYYCCRDQDDCLHFQETGQSSPLENAAPGQDSVRVNVCRYCGRELPPAALKQSEGSYSCSDLDDCLAYQEANPDNE